MEEELRSIIAKQEEIINLYKNKKVTKDRKKYNKERYQQHKEEMREEYQRNKERIKERNMGKKDEVKIRNQKHYQSHKNEIIKRVTERYNEKREIARMMNIFSTL
tara:strand:- start:245 stop:559 length:315 start_codon:yes stop_codon:yes gene_type:complete